MLENFQACSVINTYNIEELSYCIYLKYLLNCIAINFKYSSVANRHACRFINFGKKFPPKWPYLGLHIYLLREKNSPFIRVALKFKIKLSKLKTAYNFVQKSKFVINNSIDISK